MLKKVSEGTIQVIFLQEGDQYIAYAPAVDLSTSGKNIEEAARNFREAFSLLMEELADMGTLEEVLEGYGWRRVSKPTKQWIPPKVVKQIEQTVTIPLAA